MRYFESIRNDLLIYQLTEMLANIFERVQNEPTLMANIH